MFLFTFLTTIGRAKVERNQNMRNLTMGQTISLYAKYNMRNTFSEGKRSSQKKM